MIAKVDADAHKDLASRFDVKGFPTLKWFSKGSKKPEEYNGGRELDDLAAFIAGKTGLQAKIVKPVTHVKHLTSVDFDSTVKVGGVNALVELYAPWCGQ